MKKTIVLFCKGTNSCQSFYTEINLLSTFCQKEEKNRVGHIYKPLCKRSICDCKCKSFGIEFTRQKNLILNDGIMTCDCTYKHSFHSSIAWQQDFTRSHARPHKEFITNVTI